MSLIKVWVFIQKLWLWLTWYFILSFIVPKLLPNFVSNMGRILGGLVRFSPWNQYRTIGLLLVFGGMELLANLLGFTSCWKQNFMINLYFKLFSITRPNYFLVVAFNKLFLYKCNYFTVFIYQIEVRGEKYTNSTSSILHPAKQMIIRKYYLIINLIVSINLLLIYDFFLSKYQVNNKTNQSTN